MKEHFTPLRASLAGAILAASGLLGILAIEKHNSEVTSYNYNPALTYITQAREAVEDFFNPSVSVVGVTVKRPSVETTFYVNGDCPDAPGNCVETTSETSKDPNRTFQYGSQMLTPYPLRPAPTSTPIK